MAAVALMCFVVSAFWSALMQAWPLAFLAVGLCLLTVQFLFVSG